MIWFCVSVWWDDGPDGPDGDDGTGGNGDGDGPHGSNGAAHAAEGSHHSQLLHAVAATSWYWWALKCWIDRYI